MKNFKQKPIPEGINSSNENPLKEFFFLVLAFFIAITVLGLLLFIGGKFAAHWVSVEQEIRWTNGLTPSESLISQTDLQKKEDRVQRLANSLWLPFQKELGLNPNETKLSLNLLSEATPNAFMTLGGNMTITEGALKGLKSENELSFIICHEIGHLYHRHVLGRIGQRFLGFVTLRLLGAEAMAEKILGPGLGFVSLHFSRSEETQADHFAMGCLMKKYGHVGDYDAFFSRIKEKNIMDKKGGFLEYFSDHPLSEKRIEDVKKYALQKGYPLEGELTPFITSRQ